VTATALTLLILPAVYYVMEKRVAAKETDSTGQI
jgi:Cu/Ag efflux pump CusA